ncbi:MAG TPA: OmpA family protein [Terriglobia bacterium]|nr:OmpA family protein [Terriglobia bacterium]
MATLDRRNRLRALAAGIGVALLGVPPFAAAQWPWSRTPDQVTATCSIEPARLEQGSPQRLKARVEAADTRKHPLAYVWSGNGGRILGAGAAVEIDASGLNPGAYAVAAAVQDAYKNRAECTAHFQVIPPAKPMTVVCTAEPAEAPAGTPIHIRAEVKDAPGQTLRYRWFTNGGRLQAKDAAAELLTDSLSPGEYSVTARVEDELGNATDCTAAVRVLLPPPPPVSPEVRNLAQIVFPLNSAQVGEQGRAQLQTVAERMRQEPGGKISLESYAGPEEIIPSQLAAARADAVRRILLQAGVSEARMEVVVGLGGRLGGVRNRTVDVIWIPDGMEY